MNKQPTIKGFEYELTRNQCIDVALYMHEEYVKWLNNGKGKFAIYPFNVWLEKQKEIK